MPNSLNRRISRAALDGWLKVPDVDAPLKKTTTDVTLGLVWVRLRDGILVATDPNDPSFLVTADGVLVTENPISGGSCKVNKDNKDNKKELKKPRSLGIVRQDSYGVEGIEMMVRAKDVPIEVQKLDLRIQSKEQDVAPSELKCFHCDGTGERWRAVKFAYGEKAGNEAKMNYEARQAKKRGRPVLKRNDGGPSFFEHGKQDVTVNVSPEEKQQSNPGYVFAPTSLERYFSHSSTGSTGSDDDANAPASMEKCWVCRGTGLVRRLLLLLLLLLERL